MKKKALTKTIATWFTVGLMLLAGPIPSQAITVTTVTDANTLAQALFAGNTGVIITGATLSGHVLEDAASTGTFANASGIYGNIGGAAGGIVISTGNVLHYGDGPNNFPDNTTAYGVPETPEQKVLLDPVTGPADHFDVTQLDITFDMQPGFDTVYLNVAFGSEEFPEFVGSPFVDGLGIYVNGTDIAFVGGMPVNINHPGFADIRGTELDGVLAPSANPVLTFSAFVGDGRTNNRLTIIICDTNDEILDSTAYLANFGGTPLASVSRDNKLLLRRSRRN